MCKKLFLINFKWSNLIMNIYKKLLLTSATLLATTVGSNIYAKQVTLKFWSWYSNQKPAYDAIIKDFNKKYPNIKIESQYIDIGVFGQKMSAAFMADQGPDIFGAEPDGSVKGITTLIDADRVLDLTKYYKKWNLKNEFYKPVIKQLNYDGKYYSIPTSVNNKNIIYNKTIFKKYGLTPPKTYNDLKHIAQVLKKHNIYAIAFGNKNQWTGKDYFFLLAGQVSPDLIDKLNNGKVSITDKVFTKIAKKMLQLKKDGIFAKGINSMDSDGAATLFYQNKASMWFNGTWSLTMINTNMPKSSNLGVIPFPVVMKGGKTISPGGVGMNIAINSHTKHKKEVLAFTKFLTTTKAQKYFVSKISFTAANKKSNELKTKNPYLPVFNKLQNNTCLRVLLNPDLDVAISSAIQGLIEGDIAPEEFGGTVEDNM